MRHLFIFFLLPLPLFYTFFHGYLLQSIMMADSSTNTGVIKRYRSAETSNLSEPAPTRVKVEAGSSEPAPDDPIAPAQQALPEPEPGIPNIAQLSFNQTKGAVEDISPGEVARNSDRDSQDTTMDEATQPATQPYNDPRRLGRNNSGMSDHDVIDVIAILHPMNALGLDVVKTMMAVNGQHVLQNDDLLDGFDPTDFEADLMMNSPGFERDLALRMSSDLVDPAIGFVFGRNPNRCDIVLANEDKNVSNIHFSIFLNENGVLMLKDLSTNGTLVDDTWYKKVKGQHATTMLQPNATISVVTKSHDAVKFMVRYPPRGEYAELYTTKLREYITKRPGMDGMTVLPSVSGYETTYGMHWNGGTTYNVIGHLGKGAFATVYKLATKRDGKVYAAKELDKRRFVKNGILDLKVDNEMQIMSSLRHPNIVQYEGYHDFDQWIYIVMEFVPGGELSSYISKLGPVSEELAQSIARQILHALEYLHKRWITHRDIKPDNLLIASYDPFVVKLSDFGLSKCVTNQETFLKTFCGTLLYCAPEVYPDYSSYQASQPPLAKRNRSKGTSRTAPYSQAVDMWSFGAVLYHILCNKPPILGKGDDRGIHMLNNIMTKDVDYSPLRDMGISEPAIDFIDKLLDRDPNMRPSEEACFQHPWLVDVPDHINYQEIGIQQPIEYYNRLATVVEDEKEEQADDEQNQIRGPSGTKGDKENIVPEDVEDKDIVEDRLDPRYHSKRQRLRGGGPTEEALSPSPSGDVSYPSLPNLGPSPANSPNNHQQATGRLFGEVTQSALRSSGIFGRNQERTTDVPALGKSVEQISVNDFVSGEGGTTTNSEASPEIDGQYHKQPSARTARQSAAPSLFGAESDLRGLNMASPEGLQTEVATPDTANPGTPQTREATPADADTEPLHQVNSNKMPPPPLPQAPRRKSTDVTAEGSENVTPEPAEENAEYMKSKDDGTSVSYSQNGKRLLTSRDFEIEAVLDKYKRKPEPPPITKQPTKSQVEFAARLASVPKPRVPDPSVLGRIYTTPGSIITTSIDITTHRFVYGRGVDSTIKYPNVMDTRIPKYGLKLTFHGPEIRDLTSYLSSGNSLHSIPDPYVSITTSATRGINVNGVHLPNQEDKSGGFLWGLIYTGDIVTIYEDESVGEFLRFVVEIHFGESAKLRSPETPFSVQFLKTDAASIRKE